MLSLHLAPNRARRARKQAHDLRIGLAIAGGGPIGAMYELGALRALDEACIGLDLTRMDCYVGVSSGAFMAAGLANRMTTEQMCRIFLTGDSHDIVFSPEAFMRPAVGEYARRLAGMPRVGMRLLRDLAGGGGDSRWSDVVTRMGALVPNGLFDSAGIEAFLQDIFTRHGRSNDFRTLERPLYVVAVDLDTGEAVRFGGPGWDDVPISRAVQASAALPGLYAPVTVHGRHFVDGALRRTMHASVVLERGVDLMIGLNPLVPFNPAGEQVETEHRFDDQRVANGGLPLVLSQTFRTMLQSRMQVGLQRYAHQYPDIDQFVFEPNAADRDLFYSNAFSYAMRQRIGDLAYRNTLADLKANAEAIAPVLRAHGIRLDHEVLDDQERSIIDGLPPAAARHSDATARLERALEELEHRMRTGQVV